MSDLTPKQRERLAALCAGYKVPFREDDYLPAFDLPAGWVAGWVGGRDCQKQTIYVGVSPEGRAHS